MVAAAIGAVLYRRLCLCSLSLAGTDHTATAMTVGCSFTARKQVERRRYHGMFGWPRPRVHPTHVEGFISSCDTGGGGQPSRHNRTMTMFEQRRCMLTRRVRRRHSQLRLAAAPDADIYALVQDETNLSNRPRLITFSSEVLSHCKLDAHGILSRRKNGTSKLPRHKM